MKFAPVLAYTLLPLLAMAGGLAMLFSSQLGMGAQAAVIGVGGTALFVALGGLSLFMALEHSSMQAVRVRAKRRRGEDR